MFIEKILTSFLFQNRLCPLTGIGHLSFVQTSATPDFGNKKIAAPSAVIQFSSDEINSGSLIGYLASQSGNDANRAAEIYDQFCANLKNELASKATAQLSGIGNFNVDGSGNINFQPVILPPVYSPEVTAERVVHPEAEHNILVGDKETTNTAMTEYFSEEPMVKDRWWIWAIVLAALAIGILILYYNDTAASMLFGNAVGYESA